jgi:uracil-DNA glycosylase family 4
MTPEDLNKKINYIRFLTQQPKGFAYLDKEAAESLKKNDRAATISLHPSKKQTQLDALKQSYANCLKCPLATQGRKQVVFGSGNPEATLMFIGEGPGKDEDLQGLPFIGRAGKLLTSIIEAMGLTRDQVYISNVVKCRPPENRIPMPIERSTCKDILLFKEIDIIQPKIICTLGATATQSILGEEAKITQTRGLFFEWRNTLVLPTYHPAYLLRNPIEKRTVWEDMKKIMAKLTEETSP